MKIGIDGQFLLPRAGAGSGLTALATSVVQAGLDLVNFGDHLGFGGGTGFDGLINASAMLASHPDVHVQVGAYQLPARHPVLVARQLSTLSELAPGRFTFACGVGGEDRNELAMVGIDPSTRGRRMDESLSLLRQLLSGRPVSHAGEFYEFERAHVQPAPDPPIPVLIAGRSTAALRRTARLGDGWLGIWVSPERFAAAANEIEQLAAAQDREAPPRRHAISIWCGFDFKRRSGSDRLRHALENLYGLPYDRFSKWCPTGTAEDVAAAIAPYADAGCETVIVIPAAIEATDAIALTREVRDRLIAAG